MRRRAWAWWLAFDALILTVAPMPGMSGVFGLMPMSLAVADALWISALALILVSFNLWNRLDSMPVDSGKNPQADGFIRADRSSTS